MTRRPADRAAATFVAVALVAGCATQQGVSPSATSAETEAPKQRFEVSPAGVVGIALLTAVVVLAIAVASDDAVSFD